MMYIIANKVDVFGLALECEKQGIYLNIEDGKITSVVTEVSNVETA